MQSIPCENVFGHWLGKLRIDRNFYHCEWPADVTATKLDVYTQFHMKFGTPNHGPALCPQSYETNMLAICSYEGVLWLPNEKLSGNIMGNAIQLTGGDHIPIYLQKSIIAFLNFMGIIVLNLFLIEPVWTLKTPAYQTTEI